MATIDDVIREFPEPVQEYVRQIWESLPDELRRELEELLDQLPISVGPLKDILSLVVRQYRPVFGTKQNIAIVGPANVGKSTLYNRLISRKEDEADVSPIPGTTRENQESDTGLFTVIDTPGADAVGAVGEKERQIAFEAAERSDFLVIVFEATRGVKRSEQDLFDGLLALEKPFIVLLNKIDLIHKRDREQVRNVAARNLRLQPSQIIPTVATEGTNVGRIILAITKVEPGLLAAVGKALPAYRAKLAWQRIVPAGSAAGVVGLIPLPFVDLIPLLAIQSGLVLSIARIYAYDITPSRAKELIATFGAGVLARTIFQQLAKLGNLPGWVLSATIAASTTVAIGYAAMVWFERGEKLTQEAMAKIIADVTEYLKGELVSLGEKRPDRATLRERITQALNNLPSRLRPSAIGPEAESYLDMEGSE